MNLMSYSIRGIELAGYGTDIVPDQSAALFGGEGALVVPRAKRHAHVGVFAPWESSERWVIDVGLGGHQGVTRNCATSVPKGPTRTVRSRSGACRDCILGKGGLGCRPKLMARVAEHKRITCFLMGSRHVVKWGNGGTLAHRFHTKLFEVYWVTQT